MFNILSIVIGLVALLIGVIGLTPLLGSLNWIAIPVAVVGAAVGVLSSRDTGRNLNILVLVVATVRLMMGGGIF